MLRAPRVVTGAFAVDGTVYAAWSNGTFSAQPFDDNAFGAPTVIDLYAGDPSTRGYENNVVNDLAAITGMFLTGDQLFFADRTTGALKLIKFGDNRLVGTASVVNTAVDWRANALMLSSQWATLAPNPAPLGAFTATCSGLTCDVDASTSSDADGGVVDYSVDFGDGTVMSGVKTQHTYADASASTDPDGTIMSYDWDFADTSSASGETANHVFAAAGTCTVSVTVTDDRGGVDVASGELTVGAGVAGHTTPQVVVPADGQWLVSYWADRTASLTTAWTAPVGESLRDDDYSSGSSSRVTSLLTDGGGPTLAGTRGGLTATANSASRKATMWSIVLRSQ